MRTEKEIDEVLEKLDAELQKIIGNDDVPKELFRYMWNLRITLLWVKGKLESVK